MGAAGRAHVTSLYTLERLVADHAALYDEFLNARRRAGQGPASSADPAGPSDTLRAGG